MSGRFEGQSVLVTGGNSGLGLGAAQYFVDEGAAVFIAGRRQDELDQAKAELGGTTVAVQCDITVRADLDHLFTVIATPCRS